MYIQQILQRALKLFAAQVDGQVEQLVQYLQQHNPAPTRKLKLYNTWNNLVGQGTNKDAFEEAMQGHPNAERLYREKLQQKLRQNLRGGRKKEFGGQKNKFREEQSRFVPRATRYEEGDEERDNDVG